MATIVDALLVTLGLDPSGFIKGQKQASESLKKTGDEADRAAKDMEAKGKQAAQFFAQIKKEVLGLFTVFTAGKGMEAFVSDVVSSDAAVGRLATNIGMTTESLSAWQGVAERAGGSANGIAASFQNMAQQAQNFQLRGEASQSTIEALARLHIDPGKFLGAGTSQSDRMLELADVFSKMSAPQAQMWGKQIGLDEGTINVLTQGRQAVQALLAEQEKIGRANEADAKSAQQLQSAWRALTQSSTDLGRKILTGLSPYLQQLAAALLRLSEWAASHRPMVEAMFFGLAAAVTAFAVVLAAPVAGIAALSAGIGVAVAAIAVLYDDWKTWIDGGQSAFAGFWQFFADKWSEVSGVVMPVFESMKAVFADWVETAKALLGLVVALFTGNASDIRKAWSSLVDDLGKYFTDWVGLIRNLGPAILAAFKTAFTAAFSWVKNRAKTIWDAITGHSDTSSDTTDVPATPGATTAGAALSSTKEAITSGVNKIADSAFGALISKGEGDYNSVNLGARGGYKAGTADLSNMTIDQVMAAQRSGQFNAAGRYQLIGSTMADAVKSLGLKGDTKFDKETQDKIFSEYLVNNKRKAIGDYLSGKSDDLKGAIKAASMEWASVADPDTGKSHYAGVGNNKASISVDDMARALQMARANMAGGTTSTSTSEVKIGQINVQTAATDARGIARDMGGALQNNFLVSQANTGLS